MNGKSWIWRAKKPNICRHTQDITNTIFFCLILSCNIIFFHSHVKRKKKYLIILCNRLENIIFAYHFVHFENMVCCGIYTQVTILLSLFLSWKISFLAHDLVRNFFYLVCHFLRECVEFLIGGKWRMTKI